MAILAQDQITIADVTDGYSVYLEKYAHIFDGNKTGPVASCTDGEWISDESAEKCFGVLYPVCHKM